MRSSGRNFFHGRNVERECFWFALACHCWHCAMFLTQRITFMKDQIEDSLDDFSSFVNAHLHGNAVSAFVIDRWQAHIAAVRRLVSPRDLNSNA
jgi:hypothetical protein